MSRASVAVALAFALASCHGRPSVEPTERGGEAHHPVDPQTINAPGQVEPWSGEVKLASAEPGQIVALAVIEGQHVRAGELIARLEDSEQRHALAIRESELREAVAAVAALSPTHEDVDAAEAEVTAATTRAALEHREAERSTALGEAGALPATEVERAIAAAAVGDAELRVATARMRATRRGATRPAVAAARARRDAATARVAAAATALARREIRATSDGVVLWSRYHVGEFYAPEREPLVVVGDLGRLQVRLELDDADAATLAVGAACELRDDGGQLLATGRVASVAPEHGTRALAVERPTSRSDARVREVVVAVDPGSTLVPGQRVWGNIARAAPTGT